MSYKDRGKTKIYTDNPAPYLIPCYSQNIPEAAFGGAQLAAADSVHSSEQIAYSGKFLQVAFLLLMALYYFRYLEYLFHLISVLLLLNK